LTTDEQEGVWQREAGHRGSYLFGPMDRVADKVLDALHLDRGSAVLIMGIALLFFLGNKVGAEIRKL
jgi:hypothetical protein